MAKGIGAARFGHFFSHLQFPNLVNFSFPPAGSCLHELGKDASDYLRTAPERLCQVQDTLTILSV